MIFQTERPDLHCFGSSAWAGRLPQGLRSAVFVNILEANLHCARFCLQLPSVIPQWSITGGRRASQSEQQSTEAEQTFLWKESELISGCYSGPVLARHWKIHFSWQDGNIVHPYFTLINRLLNSRQTLTSHHFLKVWTSWFMPWLTLTWTFRSSGEITDHKPSNETKPLNQNLNCRNDQSRSTCTNKIPESDGHQS